MKILATLYIALSIHAAGPAGTAREARKLIEDRIETLARASHCERHPDIDLERARRALSHVRFYNAEGPEGALRFSRIVGKPASPDLPLRQLARENGADAFVLGYHDGERYVRTRIVVLARGYFEQPDGNGGARPTTEDEKQALLLHEVLHIALDKDDDELNRRELCPLRLLAYCPRVPSPVAGE